MHLSSGNILVISFGCADETMLKECQNNLSWDSYRQFPAKEGQFSTRYKIQIYFFFFSSFVTAWVTGQFILHIFPLQPFLWVHRSKQTHLSITQPVLTQALLGPLCIWKEMHSQGHLFAHLYIVIQNWRGLFKSWGVVCTRAFGIHE